MEGWRLLGRPGCHLCDEFLEEFSAAFPGRTLVQDDVDSREDWRSRFGSVIPVLMDARGEPVCETFFDLARVHAAGVVEERPAA